MESMFYSWDDFKSDIKAIVAQISQSGWMPDFVVGVKRGGLVPATLISHYMGIPLLVSSCQIRDGKNVVELIEVDESLKDKRLLIVDDICDEGLTLTKVCQTLKDHNINNFKTCSVFFNIRQSFSVDYKAKKIDRDRDKYWVVFPWEL